MAGFAAAVYLFVVLRNPAHWLRRVVSGLVTVATGSALLPDLEAYFELEWGFVSIDFNNGIAYALLAAAVMFAAVRGA